MAGEIGIPRIRQTGPADPRVRRRMPYQTFLPPVQLAVGKGAYQPIPEF